MDRFERWLQLRRDRRARDAPVFWLLFALSLYYLFVSTAGKFHTLDWSATMYDQLAEGFRAGHLYLQRVPSPRLLARANPWDWQSSDEWADWMWDATLYNGHYYLYWGPTPALILFALKSMLRTSAVVPEQQIVLVFMLLRLYAGTALIVCYARTQYPELPRWALYLAIVVFAVASPTPYFIARPLVYEASIACGQGFFCLALYCAYRGLLEPLAQTRWFVAAGSCLGCAFGGRGSVLISAPLIVLATAFCAARASGYSWRRLMAAGLALGAPVAAALALHALYNYARFDKVTEFGLNYQLTGRRVGMDSKYILPNVFSYAGAELAWSCKFPFVRLPSERHLSTLFVWPSDYNIGSADNGDRVAGILVTTIICWLWSVWILRGVVWLKATCQGAQPRHLSTRELWLVSCSIAGITSLAAASGMFAASMRYLEDAVAGIVLGAIAAGFWLLRPSQACDREASRARRWLAPALYVGLSVHTIFIGAALGFTGHADSFRSGNKALSAQLERKLSVCALTRKLSELALIPAKDARLSD